MNGAGMVFGAAERGYSRKTYRLTRAFTRYERRARFRAAGRECRFCGMICGDAAQTITHEQSPFHVEDRVNAARVRKNAAIEHSEVVA